MAQIRGTAGYHLGGPNPFGGPKNEVADPSPLDAIREQTSKIEDMLDTISEPVKPYVNNHNNCPLFCPCYDGFYVLVLPVLVPR